MFHPWLLFPVLSAVVQSGLMMLIIFLSGAIVGTGGALLAVRQHVLHKIHHPQEVPDTVAARLQRKFDLEDHQAQRNR